MTRYEKLSLVLTTLGIGAAVYIGFVQNSINQKLVDINYDPSLSITYDKPANERSSGLLLTNSGKTSITLYNVTLFAHSITDKNRTLASSSAIETVISPGSTVNVGGPDFLFATENIVRTRGEENFLLDVFLKTPNGEKYLMESKVKGFLKNGEVTIYLDSTNYRRFNWTQKD